jgi:hypothetical protein
MARNTCEYQARESHVDSFKKITPRAKLSHMSFLAELPIAIAGSAASTSAMRLPSCSATL